MSLKIQLVKLQSKIMIYIAVNKESLSFDKLIIACGGSPRISGLKWLHELGYVVVDPVPSLFTFNMPTESVKVMVLLRQMYLLKRKVNKNKMALY